MHAKFKRPMQPRHCRPKVPSALQRCPGGSSTRGSSTVHRTGAGSPTTEYYSGWSIPALWVGREEDKKRRGKESEKGKMEVTGLW